MAKEWVDKRVLNIFRWSLVVLIIFLFQSSFTPGLYIFRQGEQPSISWITLLPISVVIIILIALLFNKVQCCITKPAFLAILYIIAIMTILSRNLVTSGDIRGPRAMAPMINFFRGGWEMIFFLIIPLVFIAWQYSMREVIVYCFAIVFFESVPLAFPSNNRDPFFPLINTMGDIARSLTMLIVGWIMHQLVKVQREQHLQLMEANRKLRKFALTNEKLAQTQERNRLARELHDTLAHTLSSVSVQLEATKALFDRNPDGAKKMLDQTLTNTKNGLKETRRTLVDLRASDLESYGLTQAIRNISLSTAERGGFEVVFNLDKNLDILPDDIAHSLYRTAQEALENILRHANASHVLINMLSSGEAIQLEIKDDGKGFDVDDVSNQNLGLRGMRERIEMLGGEFTISSNSQTGTEIFVTIKRQDD
jgi:signal transduction histidine kinase